MSTAAIPTFIPAFDQIVDKFGNHPAVVENGFVNCSYSQLAERARRLAAAMQALGTTRGDVVAISIEKSADYICALLAVWYAGAAFVPIDPQLPAERMALMCDEAAVKIVLAVSGKVPSSLQPDVHAGRTIIEIDKVEADSKFNPDFPAFNRPAYEAQDLAYIIFTSGSTGLPKGVQVTHRGVVSFLQAQIASFELTSRSRSLWYLSTSFDASVSDLGTALLSGAALYIEPPDRLQPGSGLEEILRERGITYVDIPPSMLRLLDPASLAPSLKSIVIGGEACALDVVRSFATKVKLINVYGPTESTVCTSLGTCGGDWHRPLIGQPLPGITYRILDQDLNELGPLEAGQLHIGGIGLAAGYLNRPELTAAKFINHPLTGEKLYRTGDLVMLTEDGEYQFLGRTDRQVKLRGMLVEPEEIEAKLLQHPAVERAAVLKRPVKPGVSREILVAFVSANQASELDLDELRQHLSLSLPKWMLPQRLQKLDVMPLTVTGKVDLAALKTTVIEQPGTGPHFVPDHLSEDARLVASTLAQVFVQVLGVDQVAADDDFFEIGGDSLAVVEAVVTASALGLALPPALLMEYPTIAALTIQLTSAHGGRSLTASGGMTCEEILTDIDQLMQEQELPGKPVALFQQRHPENVFLTGATGFLGARLLYELALQSSKLNFYCLVRAEDEASAGRRIAAALAKHGITMEQAQARANIYPVCGHLDQPFFGLPAALWQELSEKIDTIVHCAAQVNNLASYSELRDSNLKGTMEAARLLASGPPKCLHYASTLSVFVATDRNSGTLLESDHLGQTTVTYGGYAQTKWAAEKLLRKLSDSGFPITFHRLGLITGDSVTGRGADHDFLSLFVQGLASLGAAPAIDAGDKQTVSIDITPVDFAARAMAALSLHSMDSGDFQTYHLANPESLTLIRLLTAIKRQQPDLDFLAPEDFQRLLLSRAARLSPKESAACLALCRVAGKQSDFELFRTMDLFQATDVIFDSRRAQAVLAQLEITCPAPSNELVGLYIKENLKERQE